MFYLGQDYTTRMCFRKTEQEEQSQKKEVDGCNPFPPEDAFEVGTPSMRQRGREKERKIKTLGFLPLGIMVSFLKKLSGKVEQQVMKNVREKMWFRAKCSPQRSKGTMWVGEPCGALDDSVLGAVT